MTEGILLLDKPRGKTSFYLVMILRKLLGVQKIGHAGTLDPLATGLMVMLVGKNYTRRSSEFTGHNKEYKTRIQLGLTTDSYDLDGTILSTSPLIPSLDDVEKAIAEFQGTTLQTPPMFSAKKVNGQKLCDLARKGTFFERAPTPVTMKISILEYSYPYLNLAVTCSSGTYIRSLAHDIGLTLGCGGAIAALVRTKSGSFVLEDCLGIETIQEKSFDLHPFLQKHP